MKKLMIVMMCIGLLVGCKSTVTTPEGNPATYSKAEGLLRSTLEGSVPDVVNATNATLDDLELTGIDSTVDKLKGKITARMAVGTKVSISLEAIDVDTTTIRIRVGTFGDKSISMQILRNIEQRLGK
jgi:PBP1b-binding outer membrane lipoprotein LpoB